jgi:hypothetical protein
VAGVRRSPARKRDVRPTAGEPPWQRQGRWQVRALI